MVVEGHGYPGTLNVVISDDGIGGADAGSAGLAGLPPPSHQPARQFDQTVGRFDTRPRTSNVRKRGGIG